MSNYLSLFSPLFLFPNLFRIHHPFKRFGRGSVEARKRGSMEVWKRVFTSCLSMDKAHFCAYLSQLSEMYGSTETWNHGNQQMWFRGSTETRNHGTLETG